VICGSRNWSDIHTIRKRLISLPPDSTIVHGAAPGADTIAGWLAEDLGFSVERFPADWEFYGRKAGFIRNIEMLKSSPDLVIAFHKDESKGTAHTIKEARKRGIPVEVYSEEGPHVSD